MFKPITIGLLFLGLSLFTLQCTSDNTQTNTQEAPTQLSLEDQIIKTNKVLLDNNKKMIPANAKQFVQLTHEFLKTGKDDKKAIRYGTQGAQVATNIQDYKEAISIYDDLATRFADQPKIVANALFAKAFLLENNIKDIDSAKKIYQKILKDYPNQEISKTIPAALNNLGKSEAELLEMLKKQGQ